MNEDYRIFEHTVDDGTPVDPDVALITAYLAFELSPMQVAAVERRLESDRAFAETMRALTDGWAVPLPRWERGGTAHHAAARPSDQERDAGWLRFVQSDRAPAASEEPAATVIRATGSRRFRMARIAAVIALTALPMFAVAQVVKYVARHPGAPGHEFVQAFVPASWRAAQEPPPITSLEAGGDLAWVVDAPVQQPLPLSRNQAPQPAPVVDLPAASARTTQKLASILGIKHTDDARVLVNDPLRRQVLLFERDLSTSIAVLDSVPGTSKSYGNVTPDPENAATWRTLRPFVGDSAIFGPIPTAMNVNTYLVLDAGGNVARAMAVNLRGFIPVSSSVQWDPMGRLVGMAQRFGRSFIASLGIPPARTFGTGVLAADTADVVRILDFVTNRVDTVGTILLPDDRRPRTAGPLNVIGVGNGGGKHVPVPGADGICWFVPGPGPGGPPSCLGTARQVVNPLYTVDDWALLSDGTIAFVRGSDYHVDWIHPDGTKSSSAKLPFERKLLTDADKQRLVDSTRAAIDSLDALALVVEEQWKPWKDSVTKAARAAGARIVIQELRHPGPPVRIWPYEIVPLPEIADYSPPIRRGATQPDADGNLWILPRATSLSRQGELVYDVVNPTRGLAQRVRLPVGRSIAGFGKGGVVYLQYGDLKSGFVLEKSMLPAPIPK